jgi:hypothetical protein
MKEIGRKLLAFRSLNDGFQYVCSEDENFLLSFTKSQPVVCDMCYLSDEHTALSLGSESVLKLEAVFTPKY